MDVTPRRLGLNVGVSRVLTAAAIESAAVFLVKTCPNVEIRAGRSLWRPVADARIEEAEMVLDRKATEDWNGVTDLMRSLFRFGEDSRREVELVKKEMLERDSEVAILKEGIRKLAEQLEQERMTIK